MKFLLFATAVAASTATLKTRQVSVISDALAAIASGTEQLDSAVNSFQGADQAAALQSQAASLVSLIQSSTSSINAIGPLSSSDALSLTTPLQNLGSTVDTAVNDVISKKSTFSDAGVGGVVYSTLTSLQSAAADLTTAALSKVPDGLQGAGQSFAQPIADSLAKGVAAFQEFAGTSTSSSGGSTPSTSTGSSYPTSAPATTSSSGGNNSYPATTSTYAPSGTTSTVPTYTGAANKVGGFGAAAAAALAVAALV